mmetsp:Transcript_5605/g.9048  ORF Transcript_5605/g.9048 Transcript_5605/m.9048 type:complete len:235 (-) Transcript_5605:1109-1813(-)
MAALVLDESSLVVDPSSTLVGSVVNVASWQVVLLARHVCVACVPVASVMSDDSSWARRRAVAGPDNNAATSASHFAAISVELPSAEEGAGSGSSPSSNVNTIMADCSIPPSSCVSICLVSVSASPFTPSIIEPFFPNSFLSSGRTFPSARHSPLPFINRIITSHPFLGILTISSLPATTCSADSRPSSTRALKFPSQLELNSSSIELITICLQSALSGQSSFSSASQVMQVAIS